MAQRLIGLALSALVAASPASQAQALQRLAQAPERLAQALGDPMRPPAEASSPIARGEAQGGTSSRLQSVLISPGRRVAVIDGRTVGIGERVGDATLIAIAESEVTLQRGAERQTLKLHPGIEKKPVPQRAERKVNP